MNDTDLFLILFSILFAIGSIIAYNIDFSKWEDKYLHE